MVTATCATAVGIHSKASSVLTSRNACIRRLAFYSLTRRIASRTLRTVASMVLLCGMVFSQNAADLPGVIRMAGQFPQQASAAASTELVRIQIFTNQSLTDEVFEEQQSISIGGDGTFNLLVGAATPGGVPAGVFKDASPRWIQVTRPNGSSMNEPLVSVPYSYHALVADAISGVALDDIVTRDQLPTAVRDVIQNSLNNPSSAAGTASGSPATRLSASGGSQGTQAVVDVTQMQGATLGELLQSCIASLSANGGVCDARSVATVPSINSTVKVDKYTRILLPTGTITCNATPCFSTMANLDVEGASAANTIVKAASGGQILAVSGNQINYLELSKMMLEGNGAGSLVLAIPDWNSSTGTDFQNGRYFFHDLDVSDFGATAFQFGRSAYFFEIKNVIFQRNQGSIKFDRYSEGQITDNSFFYPKSGAQITAVSSSITHIERNTFVNDGKNTDPDILIQPPPDGNDGYLWIIGNKFGPENEVAARYKIAVNNPAAIVRSSMAIYVHENNFSGAGGAQTAIELLNQISYWSVQNNLFNNVGIAIGDDQPILTGIDFGHSVFRGNRMFGANGQPVIAFKNGGRGFDLDSDSVAVVQLAGTSNEILNSERQDKWGQNSTTTTCGIDDPFGTQRACRVSRNGTYISESIQGPLVPNGLTAATLTFWARSGSLSRADLALYDSTTWIMVSMTSLYLSPGWQKFTVPFSGFDPTHTLKVLVYPGGSNIKVSGWIDVYGFQFGPAGQSYAVSGSSPVNSAITESRHDERVTFANQIVSTVSTGTAPMVVTSTTPVANLTLLFDSQLPTIGSPGKIVETALPTLTLSGKIKESALPTIVSSGIISDSAVPSTIARLSGPVSFAGPVSGTQLASLAPQGSAPLVVTSNTKVANLNSDLLDGADWNSPGVIGASTPNAATFTRLTATVGVANSSGLQHLRVAGCTTAMVNGKQECTTTVTWPVPFADTAYTVTCTQENTDASSVQVFGLVSKSAESVVVRVVSDSNKVSSGGNLGCIALHD